MRRRIDNPPNPYLTEHCEWLGEPPAAPLEVHEEQARTILSENESPDIPFRFSLNPYRGCQHACAYCYARPTHEYLGLGAGTDFDTRITVKVNAPELLERELRRPKLRDEWIAFGGVTDCYQPLEAVYRLTRRCLEICAAQRRAVGIVTKAYLVVRDCDVLQVLRDRASVRVWVSIPFADAQIARAVETGAPSPARRLEALRTLRAAGIPTGVMVAPLIPGLNDREIPKILEQAGAAGASRAAFVALRLPGSVRPVFLERLRAAFPERADRVEARIRDMRGGGWNNPQFGARMVGEGPYWASVRTLFENTAARLGLNRTREATLGELPPGASSSDETRAPESARTIETEARPPGARQLPLFPS